MVLRPCCLIPLPLQKNREQWGGVEWIQSALCENCPWAEPKQQGQREAAAGWRRRKTCVHMLISKRKEEMRCMCVCVGVVVRGGNGGSRDGKREEVFSYADQQTWEYRRRWYRVAWGVEGMREYKRWKEIKEDVVSSISRGEEGAECP